ncbi:ATP-dependent DNA helicase PIF1-like [Octopus sinensis]|uniref:ATP-dependent DNA helicase PIF1-like n=1 Tax=Octopus sinensis TaxID=2607531 RepID=A0A6P7S6H8_9MOLL|nr:ATP-dependent DNA helicase PIF1-like [Octopus sinensis]
MRNLNLPSLCNGMRIIVEELLDNLKVARINRTAFRNEITTIPRITMNLSEGEDIPLQRSQFPVQSCFAMTIHKAQGQTMDNVLIEVERPVIQHGQLYVALSRGRRKENVRVFLKDTQSTKNVVIKSFLSSKLQQRQNEKIFLLTSERERERQN